MSPHELENCIAIFKKERNYLVFNKEIVDWFVTDLNGLKILKDIVRKNSVRSDSVLSPIEKKIIGKIKKWESSLNKENVQSHQIPQLRTVYLNITSKCNLSCNYCFAAERSIPEKELGFEQFSYVIAELNEMCTEKPSIVFTGGEPLMSDFLLDLAEFAKRQGNEIVLLTNGTMIDKFNAKQVSDLFDLTIISLDSTTPRIHNIHRGKGAFSKAINGIDLLSRNSAHYSLSATVTALSKKEVTRLARKYGNLIKFAPFFPNVGRAKYNNKFSISGIEYYSALSADKHIAPWGKSPSAFSEMRGKRIRRCAMGWEQISIDSEGNVYPCHLLHVKEFLCGNITEASVKEIYFNSSKLNELRKNTVDQISGCCNCDIRYVCGGGCRARAYWDSGSIRLAGKFCDYEYNCILDGLFQSCQGF